MGPMNQLPPQNNLHLATSQDATRLNNRLVEAARYTLLKRLAPAMRHEVAGALQPLKMVSAVLSKRLQVPEPDLAALLKNSDVIGQLLREATAVCTEFTDWIAPKQDEKLPIQHVVNECIKLLRTNLMLRGFTIDLASEVADAELPAAALRQVFSVCVLALTDLTPGPACISISFQESENEVLTRVHIEPVDGEEPHAEFASYRPLEWDDVQLLAGAEAVGLKRLTNGAELIFRR